MIWLWHHDIRWDFKELLLPDCTELPTHTLKDPLKAAQKQRKANMLKEKLTYNSAVCKLNQNVPESQPSKKMFSLSNNNTLYCTEAHNATQEVTW